MSEGVVIMMLSASVFLGFLSLVAFIWGLKNNQFEDSKRSSNIVLFDSEEDLNDAAKRDKKRKAYEEKRAK